MKQLVQTAGVAPESIKFGTCSLQSDKYICVCQGGELVIVDMTAGNAVKRWPISAEAAIMNPTQKIVALRGKKRERERETELSRPPKMPPPLLQSNTLLVIIFLDA